VRANEIIKLGLGGSLIYAFIAACSASGVGGLTNPVPNADAAGSSGGTSGGGGSGSRLKASRFQGADGSNPFIEWRDSARKGEPCNFSTAADGKTRCLPVSSSHGINTYADSACTKVITFTLAGCAPGKYVSDTETGDKCTEKRAVHIYPVEGTYAGALIWEKVDGKCTDRSRVNEADAYSLGAEINPSEFVEATVQTDP